ncbi:Kae1-associated serine/threonine protein kinase [Candidatus Woesearchaeota archaeon]|nr:Kae1-associated serine/threonine protein kinase [Candidatus Woesearchaeota archaeon]
MEKIAQGAEAVLYLDKSRILKERLSKGYRLPHIDIALRKFRTRREAKILTKLADLNFPAPHLHEFCDKRMSIFMDFVPGEQLKDVIEGDYQILAQEIGKKIAVLHQNDIIHGDLTTSNMIQHQETGEINFLDFGLSFFSNRAEDKAVDLFLLDRALESKHHKIYPQVFQNVIESYKKAYPEYNKILERFEKVKSRGRNKNK